jgi:hypothetical protein
MAYFRHAALVVALAAGVGAASAQTTVITTQPVETQGVAAPRTIVLTPDQRQVIYRDVIAARAAPAPAAVEYRVGGPVPGNVELYPVPQSVAVAVPAVKAYRYMVVNGRVVLVDPATSEVVAEISD